MLTACNYGRCVFVAIFFLGFKIRLRRLQTIRLVKIKKNGLSDLIDSKIEIRAEIHSTP